MQRYNDAFDLVHAFPRLLRKELPRERARARARLVLIAAKMMQETDGGQRREADRAREERGGKRPAAESRLIALNLPRGFCEIYSGTRR